MSARDQGLQNPLPAGFQGTVHRPDDPGYDDARTIYQGRARDHGPALIASCINEEDVVIALRHASSLGVPIAVRGGGHGSDGTAMPADAFVVDLSAMRAVTVDEEALTVTAEPGVLLGELDAAAQEYGLAVPAGTVSTTGVAGLTLGGGIGHLMRRFGATVDNVIGFDLVTVDGRRVRADAEENPDLFWALRGGGGNFGVVTGFHFRAHHIGTEVFAGQIIFPFAQAEDVLKGLPEIIAQAPRELGLLAAIVPVPELPGVPEEAQGEPAVVVIPVWSGDPDLGPEIVQPVLQLGTPLVEMLGRTPWTQANSMLDVVAGYDVRMNLRGGYLPDFSPESLRPLLDHAVETADLPGTTTTNLWAMGGAISEDTGEDDVAFSRAGAAWLWETVHMWDDPQHDDQLNKQAESISDAMQPYILSNGYSNLSDDRGPKWRSTLHGSSAKHERLRALKCEWDPQNLLRHNKNITPADGD